MNDHYCSAHPASPAELRERRVMLGEHSVDVVTAPGVFSADHLDTGTAVLISELPVPPAGNILDLGCGWGPLALHAGLSARSHGVDVQVYALDVNERALDLARTNAQRLGLDCVTATSGDGVEGLEFAAIWSNPPIRVGKAVLHDLLMTWLPRLRSDGEAQLVVAKNLGADSLQKWLKESLGADWTVRRRATAKGFRVLNVHRTS